MDSREDQDNTNWKKNDQTITLKGHVAPRTWQNMYFLLL